MRVFVGGRIEVPGDHEVLAQCDRVQVLLGGPPAQPPAPLVLEDEVLHQLAVITGEIVPVISMTSRASTTSCGRVACEGSQSRPPRKAKFSPWSKGT